MGNHLTRSAPAVPGRRAIGPRGTAAQIVAGVGFLLLGGLGGGGIDWTALLVGLAAMPAIATLAQLARLSVSKTALHATGRLAFCLNLAIGAVLLATPWTSHPTSVFLGASMLLAAWRAYAGCETPCHFQLVAAPRRPGRLRAVHAAR
jgi:hypothetical protein